jgi:hypothetical protein
VTTEEWLLIKAMKPVSTLCVFVTYFNLYFLFSLKAPRHSLIIMITNPEQRREASGEFRDVFFVCDRLHQQAHIITLYYKNANNVINQLSCSLSLRLLLHPLNDATITRASCSRRWHVCRYRRITAGKHRGIFGAAKATSIGRDERFRLATMLY